MCLVDCDDLRDPDSQQNVICMLFSILSRGGIFWDMFVPYWCIFGCHHPNPQEPRTG